MAAVSTVAPLWAPLAWLGGGWRRDVLLRIGADGCWAEVRSGVAAPAGATRLPGPVLPGMVDAHSHAFQRAFAGLAERRSGTHDDFWSWRDRMYAVASRVTPEQLHAIACQLYAELLQGGYTQVCEFHYLHHDHDGQPYDDGLTMAWTLADAAAEAGSFTHAGEQQHTSQSAVSRQISALEANLKVTLFHRHARGLVLTEQGELLNRTVAEVFAKLQTAETLLSDSTSKPSGDLRITAPIGFGTIWLTPRLQEFGDLYPEIRVELILNDDQVDIGIVLLGADTRAEFINRAFRDYFALPDEVADSQPPFIALMYHGRDTGAYELPEDQLAHFIAARTEMMRTGDSTPININLADGKVLRFCCTALPDGGRMLSYTPVTDLVRHGDAPERAEHFRSLRKGQRPPFPDRRAAE